VKFTNPCLNVRSLLRIGRSQLCWFDHVTRMTQERLASNRAGHIPGKAAEISSMDQVASVSLRPCLVPFWCGASGTITGCWKLWGISRPPRVAVPANFPGGRQGVKRLCFIRAVLWLKSRSDIEYWRKIFASPGWRSLFMKIFYKNLHKIV